MSNLTKDHYVAVVFLKREVWTYRFWWRVDEATDHNSAQDTRADVHWQRLRLAGLTDAHRLTPAARALGNDHRVRSSTLEGRSLLVP